MKKNRPLLIAQRSAGSKQKPAVQVFAKAFKARTDRKREDWNRLAPVARQLRFNKLPNFRTLVLPQDVDLGEQD